VARRSGAAGAGLLLALAACGGDDDAAGTPASTSAAGTAPTSSVDAPGPTDGSSPGGRCLVRLHGKGGAGADPVTEGDVTIVAPTGNADGWGARQWLYFPADEYAAARQIVAGSVTDCGQVIVHGFSNGASFAASLYCHGETFDGRLVGVVIDDPVTDRAVIDCSPDPAVAVTLYATGALEETATPGWSCADADWTCEGGETMGIDAYAAALGTAPRQSPFTEHEWYVDAPESTAWAS
jgi:hypothetical protein